MALPIRPIAPGEFDAFYTAVELAFGSDVVPAALEAERALAEPERFIAAHDGDHIVGTAGAFSFDMTVPGTTAPVAGVTMVGVAPTHRRRGLLTALKTRQLADIHALGRESVAALWASESPIYGRFGYGLASRHLNLNVPTLHSRFVRPVTTDGVRLVDYDTAMAAAPAVYDRVAARRAGCLARSSPWWSRRLGDPEHERHGASAARYAVFDGTSGIEGYAMYRVKVSWANGVSENEIQLRELIGATPEATAALWRFLLDHDLAARVTTWHTPLDDPLLDLLLDPRRAQPLLRDGLWVRLVDVRTALTQRRYRTSGRLVLNVTDTVCPWNTGRVVLETDGDATTCEPTDVAADLDLGVADLGAVYLGGGSMTALAGAGRVRENTSGALATADLLFAWTPLPWCPEVF